MADEISVPSIGAACSTPGQYKKIDRRDWFDEMEIAQYITFRRQNLIDQSQNPCPYSDLGEFVNQDIRDYIAGDYNSLRVQLALSQLQFNHVIQTVMTEFICEFKKKAFSSPLLMVTITKYNPNITFQGEGSNPDWVHRMPLGWVQWGVENGTHSSERLFIRQLKQFIPSPHPRLIKPFVYFTSGVDGEYQIVQ